MPSGSFPSFIVLKAAAQPHGLILLPAITIRRHRKPVRIDRAIAGPIIWEEEKTRIEIRSAPAHR